MSGAPPAEPAIAQGSKPAEQWLIHGRCRDLRNASLELGAGAAVRL